MRFNIQQVARALSLELMPAPAPIAGWSVDSRTVSAGELFFALRGPAHDGHDYVEAAYGRGVVGAVVERPFEGRTSAMVVPDTQQALERVAAWARCQWEGKVVGITGSAGKTTTKEIVAALLGVAMPVGKTVGNLNNHVGLPLSILRLPADARAAVLEIGMNHPGEIRRLAAIAKPSVGVVTNVGFAHSEFFDSPDGVALAKRELIEALPHDGTAVLNADDPRVIGFRDVHPGPAITYAIENEADVRPDEIEFTADGVRFRLGAVEFESCLMGRHGAMNILAGIAAARAFGIAPERLVDAVRALAPGKMRGERFTHAGITILNDCYNSNPEAARSMVDVLRATPAQRRIAVLGEMLELGRLSEPLHRDVGAYVAKCGIDVLVGIRGAACHMTDEFEAARSGLAVGAAFFFEDPVEAGEFLRGEAREGDAVLFKGSRGTRVERALERFLA